MTRWLRTKSEFSSHVTRFLSCKVSRESRTLRPKRRGLAGAARVAAAARVKKRVRSNMVKAGKEGWTQKGRQEAAKE